MNSVLKVNYHIDKLNLIYKTPGDFLNYINSDYFLSQSFFNETNVFIFNQKVYATKYVVPRYLMEYRISEHFVIKLGEFKQDIKDAITLEVDNRFLYSDRFELLYKFEELFGLELLKIAQIDVACDSNHNLPRKLNDVMHKSNCTITRKGTKLPLTEKGNQIIGTRVSQNIKTLANMERPNHSFYYSLRTSGSRTPVRYRAYNKGLEIKEKSHKDYIKEKNGFGDSIYRIEVSVKSYELKMLSRKKSGYTLEYIYQNLNNSDLLREFFIQYLNRIGTLTIDGKRIKISEILRLE